VWLCRQPSRCKQPNFSRHTLLTRVAVQRKPCPVSAAVFADNVLHIGNYLSAAEEVAQADQCRRFSLSRNTSRVELISMEDAQPVQFIGSVASAQLQHRCNRSGVVSACNRCSLRLGGCCTKFYIKKISSYSGLGATTATLSIMRGFTGWVRVHAFDTCCE
jgi:hypothetical protein